MDYSDTAVIIPCYNEAVTIGKVIVDYIHTGLVPRFPTAILAASFMFLCGPSLATGFVLDSVAKVKRKQWELQVYKTHYPNDK